MNSAETDAAKRKAWTEEESTFLIKGFTESRELLVKEIRGLSDDQWNFKELPDRWSIREVVEHLEIQDEMYAREMSLVITSPQQKKFAKWVKGHDEKILQYEHDPTLGSSGWLLAPTDRYCSLEEAEQAFLRTRNHMLAFISDTDLDLRNFFTFRKYPDDGSLTDPDLWDVRDLHQLMLTCIAHTRRHIGQVQKVKAHPDYPGVSKP